jgi:two-component system sensor histidine kinase MprB
MPLNRRLAWVAAAAVGVAIVLVAIVCYMVVRSQLRGQVDNALTAQARLCRASGAPRARSYDNLPGTPGQRRRTGALRPDRGSQRSREQRNSADVTLPVSHRAASPGRAGEFSDVTVGGNHLRDDHVPGQLQVAHPAGDDRRRRARPPARPGRQRPLEPAPDPLLLCAAGIALAAMLGRIAARRVLAPLAEVARPLSTSARPRT